MATFISTIQFSDQGMKEIRASCGRAAAFKSAVAEMEIEVKAIYWTMGPFDGVVVFDAPDDEAASAAMLYLGSFGNVHSQTARAYNAAEMADILGKLPS